MKNPALGLIVAIAYLTLNTSCSRKLLPELKTAKILQAEPRMSGFSIPWDIEWLGDEKMLVTELEGKVSLVNLSTQNRRVILNLEEIANELQGGLMGMSLHPNFPQQPEVFLASTYYEEEDLYLKLSGYMLSPEMDTLIYNRTIVDQIPAAATNVGGRILTTEQHMYLTVGEMEDSAAAQDLESYKGKTLRYMLDGSIPIDNPITDSPVYASGLRNPQGICAYNNKVYTSEHGTLSDDELNLLTPLGNYGWPQSIGHSGDKTAKWTAPIKAWTPTIAPCGIAAYQGNKFPFLKNHILITTLVAQSLRATMMDETGQTVLEEKIFLEEDIGRIRDVTVTPEGRIFVCSSNADSYGAGAAGEDGIYELESATNRTRTTNALSKLDDFLQLDQTKLEIKELTNGLVHPWDITWGPDERLWLTEAGGYLKRLDPVTQEIKLMHLFKDTHETKNNPGIYSLAFHPDFKNHPFLFIHYQTDHLTTKLVRFEYDLATQTLSNRVDIIPEMIGNESHNGSRIIFTPDHKLLFALGDAYTTERAQDTTLLNGSILRMNIDGSVPDDNPFPGNLIWSYGHRNPQGMALEPNGNLYSVEHGPANDDELNRIIKGGNYGWPLIKGKCDLRSEKKKNENGDYLHSIIDWTPTVAPCGMIYYNSDAIPDWKNSLLITFLKKGDGSIGQRLGVYPLDSSGKITGQHTDYFVKTYGRLRAITQAPDGRVFVVTSNNEKSGNGDKSMRENDDKVLELRAVR